MTEFHYNDFDFFFEIEATCLRDRNMKVTFCLEGGFEILRFDKILLVQPVFMKSTLCASSAQFANLQKKFWEKRFWM